MIQQVIQVIEAVMLLSSINKHPYNDIQKCKICQNLGYHICHSHVALRFVLYETVNFRLSKFCGRQSLKRFKEYGLLKNLKFFEGHLPQSLHTPFLNTLFYMIIIFPGNSKLYLVEPSVVLLKSLLKINNNLSDIITVLQRPLVQSK